MKALVLALLALSGCYFKTRDTLVETPVSAPKVSTNIVTSPDAEVVAKTRANVISFRVSTRRQCLTQTMQTFEIAHGKKLDIAFTPWLAAALVIPAAFVAIAPVTGLIAFAQVKGHKPELYTETRVIARSSYACSLRRSGELARVRFPSGQSFEARTDERGIASVTIPDDEVAQGSARIELANAVKMVHYDRRAHDRQLLAIEVDE